MALGSIGLVLLAGIASTFFTKPLASTKVQVQEETPAKVGPFTLQPQTIGALRVDVEASIPVNRWLTYEVQLRDQQDQVLAAAIKQAWNETGTWYEEGESGSWQESDLQAGLDVLGDQAQPVTLVIEVLEYATNTSQELSEPVTFRLTAYSGIIDTRYLWTGFWGSLLIAILTLFATGACGWQLIDKRIGDSDVGDRAIMGGPDQLIKVIVKVRADETSPPALTCHLFIKDGNGNPVYKPSLTLPMRLIKDEDGEVLRAQGQITQHLVLQTRSSYGVYVKIQPDRPVDETRLMVQEGRKTLTAIDVVHLETV